MFMAQHGSRFVYGATLFSTPGLKSGAHLSMILSLAFVLILVVLALAFIRRGGSKPGPPNSEGDDGWRKGPEPPSLPLGPSGGIPLDDAAQSRMRLRGKGRLSNHRRPRVRRPAREPDRTPVREISIS
jgi:hypothetical protein